MDSTLEKPLKHDLGRLKKLGAQEQLFHEQSFKINYRLARHTV